MKFQFYCIIIILLLSIFFINNIHAQNELPYKSLFDFQNDTTVFINYNFIDRAEQYVGKTLEFIVRDLQIPVKYIFMNIGGEATIVVVGLYLGFYSREEVNGLCNSTINKPYCIDVNWEEKVPIEDFISLVRSGDYNKMINKYKDFRITKIGVGYPPKSEHEKNR
ncbi:MAG: hypothetical protein FWD60_00825 [Candidatus Azobacteroides sp.]|nr:hypothetical protein [Candidatus Azobacteroides sp.]